MAPATDKLSDVVSECESAYPPPNIYSVAVGRDTPNSTKILRCPNFAGSLVTNLDLPSPVNNIWELFLLGHAINANGRCLGCRKLDGKFEWCSYNQVRDWVLALGSSFSAPPPPLDTETEPGTPFVQTAVPPPLKAVADVPPKVVNASPTNTSAPWLVPIVDLSDCRDQPGCDRPFRPLGICSRSRVEWIVTQLAANAYDVTVVPLYSSLGQDAIIHILKQTRMHTVALGEDGVEPFIAAASQTNSGVVVRHVILFDKPSPTQSQRLSALGLVVWGWREVLAWGESNLRAPPAASLEAVDSICYTSGTTGSPKGVVLPNSSIVAVVAGVLQGPLGESSNFAVTRADVHLAFLPLAHILEKVVEIFLLSRGAAIAYYSGDIRKLTDELQAVRPTVLVGVPRVFNRIHDQIFATVASKSLTSQALFSTALRSKCQKFRRTGSIKNFVWDHLVFSKVRGVLGGRVRVMLSGSAPLDPTVGERLAVTIAAPLVEGFGLTETAGASLCTKLWKPLEGHVGGPVPCCEVKLTSIPELSYSAKDAQPRGEILVRGASVFRGYFRSREGTEEVLDKHGWFHTGDIGELLPSGSIKIIDRKKNVFKLSQGEFIAPERLEAIYSTATFVEKIFVYGSSHYSRLGAVVFPNREAVASWLAKKNNSSDLEKLCDEQDVEWSMGREVRNAILDQLDEIGTLSRVCGFEKIKVLLLTKDDFTVENGMLTPSLKLVRREALKKYGDRLDELLKDENCAPDR